MCRLEQDHNGTWRSQLTFGFEKGRRAGSSCRPRQERSIQREQKDQVRIWQKRNRPRQAWHDGKCLEIGSGFSREWLGKVGEKDKRTNGHKIEPKMINLHRKCRFFVFYAEIFAYIGKKQYLCRAKVCRKRKCLSKTYCEKECQSR